MTIIDSRTCRIRKSKSDPSDVSNRKNGESSEDLPLAMFDTRHSIIANNDRNNEVNDDTILKT